ncbi:zinc transporter ZntB [Alloalcanivorax xenomutans]|uniref:Zinc transporter ZntB n=1 Tax=Alloalcanivorax xenomutans TaxID=1094342 RepID=A0A9Q3ZGD7_9GAMM|nr:zinc transporter ZntB [Alloalcanivorax xenomutans]MCE7509279.1 zinc transporter ZntB [Alloalcanivorax xenomutans]PHS60496.1 MAG: zinc transporter ZntB [Alcanivorax sp.]CUR47300.1 Magnesium and cobalt transport protein CorA [Alloalcanivorax xenomutans]
MTDPGWLKFALRLDGKGGAAPFEPQLSAGDHSTRWIHLDYTCPESRDWLEARADIPMVVSEALLTPETRPRVSDVGGGLLVYLRGVNLSPDARPEDMIAVRLWIRDGLVISTQKRTLKSLTELVDALHAGEGPATPSELLAGLVDGLVWRMEEVIEQIEDQVADFSERLEGGAGNRDQTRWIGALRRRAITLRRYMAPERDALAKLHGDSRIRSGDAEIIREATDRLQRLLEDLDAAREHATLLQEEVFSAQNETINDRMYLLAIISATFLPLGFLTGLFGINVGGLPWLEDPNGFWWFTGMLVITGTGILLWMIRRRWV